MRDFETVLNERRAAVKFIPGVELPDKELDDIFNLVKFAPSAYNLQHTHYIVVKDPQVKDKIYEAALIRGGKRIKVNICWPFSTPIFSLSPR